MLLEMFTFNGVLIKVSSNLGAQLVSREESNVALSQFSNQKSSFIYWMYSQYNSPCWIVLMKQFPSTDIRTDKFSPLSISISKIFISNVSYPILPLNIFEKYLNPPFSSFCCLDYTISNWKFNLLTLVCIDTGTWLGSRSKSNCFHFTFFKPFCNICLKSSPIIWPAVQRLDQYWS